MAVMTPMERVEKLRAATTAPDGSYEKWARFRGMVCSQVDACTCGGGQDTFPHEAGCGLDRPVVSDIAEPDAEHIARWDPVAAGKVLDLLATALEAHGGDPEDECSGCGAWLDGTWKTFPADECAVFRASLAVLDALDGGGEQR